MLMLKVTMFVVCSVVLWLAAKGVHKLCVLLDELGISMWTEEDLAAAQVDLDACEFGSEEYVYTKEYRDHIQDELNQQKHEESLV